MDARGNPKKPHDLSEALRHAEERFKGLIELSSEWYWEQDENCRFTLVTGSTPEHGGIDPKNFLGTFRWDRGAVPVGEGGSWDKHKAVLEARQSFTDFVFKRPDSKGGLRYISTSGQPVFDDKGRFRGYRGIAKDITETKRAEEQQRRFRAAMDSSADLMLLIDRASMRYIDVNDAACRALGYTREELLAMGPQDIFSKSREELVQLYDRMFAGDLTAPTVEGVYRCKDGSQLLIEAHPRAVRSAAGDVVVSIARDIRERKREEQLLSLEHTVTRWLSEADSAADALKSVIRAICESQGWECGRYFYADEKAGLLRFGEAWGVPEATIERYIAASRDYVSPLDSGSKARVWRTGEPLWNSELSRHGRLVQSTLGSARDSFVFAVTSGGKALGVLSFTSRKLRQPDERLLKAVRVIGSQIGQFVQRKQAEEAVRESETYYRALSELSADWYWEQDAQFRFTQISGHMGEKKQFPRELWLGKTRWELPYVGVSEDDWRGHKAALEAHRPFRDFVVASRRKDGSLQHISTSGYPIFDSAGKFNGYRGIARDVSERRRAEELLMLEHTVTRCLAEADSLGAALKAAIRAVCETEGWACGRYLRVDEKAGVLRFGEAWNVPDARIELYLEESRAAVYGPGVGLVGLVWQSGQPLWVPDTSKDTRTMRKNLARESGLYGAIFFPVLSEGKTIGVLTFNSREVREPDERLLQAVRVIGSQIGQFVQRKQAEDAVRESEERFRSLTGLSSDFYWETDAEHRLVQTRYDRKHQPVIPRGNRAGKRRWEVPSTRPDDAGWAAHRATLEAHLAFRDFELARIDENGVERHLSISGEPVFDAAGVFTGYRGVGKEITARKRAEKLQALEHAVNRSLADVDSVTAAVRAVIRAVCETEGWECGRYFRWDERGGVLRFDDGWSVPVAAVEQFIEKSRYITYAPGTGLAGRVWQTVQPLWVPDVTKDARIATATLFRDTKMRGAFVFPVTSEAEGKPIGVLAFNSREVREPDEQLLEAIRVIGSQIGQFLRRKQGEEELRRFRAAIDVSADLVFLVDPASMLYVDANETACRALGYSREELLAMGPHDTFSASREDLARLYDRLIAGDLSAATAEGWYRRKDGSRLLVDSFRRAVPSAKGHVIVAVARDIGERRRAEQLLKLEHTVTRSLAEADGVSGALKAAMQAVCETEGWECGRYLRVDVQAGVLRVGEVWGIQTEAIQRFLDSSRGVTYAPGAGLAGRVWQSGEPLWLADVGKDSRAAQSSLIKEIGLHGAVFFPMMVKDKMIGILAFNSREVREPEERLLEAMRVIGSQIGQFVRRKEAELVVRESEERFRSLTVLSSDLYWEQDEQFRFTSMSGTGSDRVNMRAFPLIGKKRWEQNYINMTADAWAEHIAALEAHKPFRDMELCRLDESGKKVWISISGEPLIDASGAFTGYRGVGKDITERKLDEEHIQFLANHDALTSLPNRAMFGDVLNLAIQNARRYNRNFAVLFIDLDRFKNINDTLGHETGDKLLQEMGSRLTQTVRSSDVVARLGGDEFVVLVQEVSEAKQVEAVARKILSALVQPMVMQGQECRVTASIGICMYPAEGQDEQALMKNADIAMYRAKEDGKNTYKFYSEEINIHSFERMALETSLRRGLERNEFFLHYQAKLDLKTRQITGVEALIRWQHPELGMVSPVQFIPLAEETGLIVPIGKWVLNTACAQSVAWQREGLPPLNMAVNLSARQFADEDLVKDIADALQSTGLQPELLELELTESMVIQNPERAGKVLAEIKKMGPKLAIDDFGVGYSSLTHLKRFPIDTLKVDRSFIRDLPQDLEDKAITEAIIAMGRSLHLRVVAEGVETLEQQTFLQDHACDEMQGFFFSKPISGGEFAELLRKHIKG